MEATVCVGTFGDPSWSDLAHERAIPSIEAPLIHSHADTLAEARNGALEKVTTEWVIFLDADDELEPGYIDAMAQGTADVRGPSVAYVVNGRRRNPYVPRVAGHHHACGAECLPDGNWLIIGSAIRTESVRAVGGFREFPVYEDWDLFLRLYLAGLTFEAIPAAVYRAHHRDDSRNRAPDPAFKEKIHWDIYAANFPDAYGRISA